MSSHIHSFIYSFTKHVLGSCGCATCWGHSEEQNKLSLCPRGRETCKEQIIVQVQLRLGKVLLKKGSGWNTVREVREGSLEEVMLQLASEGREE